MLDEPCKYLGMEESDGIDNSQMKDKLVKEYYLQIRQILKIEVNLKNTITAINMLAVPVLVYSFVIVNWLRKVVEKMDWKMRKLLTIEGILHLKADRLYIKRWNGGHGLVEMEFAYNATIVGLSVYIKQGKDRLTRLVQEYDTKKTK